MKTKVYGTIGPACCDTDTLVRLFEKGMTGIRINLSHTSLKDASTWIDNIQTAYRSVCKETGKPDILMDLRGPELRIGRLTADCKIRENDILTLVKDGQEHVPDSTEVPVSVSKDIPASALNKIPVPGLILPYLKMGQEILVDDGKVLLVVEELTLAEDKSMGGVKCRVLRGNVIKSGKSIALPGIRIASQTLTDSDRENIAAAKEYGITGVMLPFVRNREDLMNLKEELCKVGAEGIRIFAKIENMEGVSQLPELFLYCDEIVIARGDLGNALPLWKLPVLQEQIARRCKAVRKPFMVVTEMLASMEQKEVPTRAEVSDVFRAVESGAASVMLTGETAAGKYPVEAMTYLVNTVKETEEFREAKEEKDDAIFSNVH